MKTITSSPKGPVFFLDSIDRIYVEVRLSESTALVMDSFTPNLQLQNSLQGLVLRADLLHPAYTDRVVCPQEDWGYVYDWLVTITTFRDISEY